MNLNLQEETKGLRTISGNSNIFAKGKNEVIYVGARKNLNKNINENNRIGSENQRIYKRFKKTLGRISLEIK